MHEITLNTHTNEQQYQIHLGINKRCEPELWRQSGERGIYNVNSSSSKEEETSRNGKEQEMTGTQKMGQDFLWVNFLLSFWRFD